MAEPELDSQTLEAFRRGDPEAQRRVFERYADRVYSIALHYLRGAVDDSGDTTYVILLDIYMPGKNGLEVLREIKRHDPDICVLMVTAAMEEEVGQQALAEGACDYIMKPIDFEYLAMALRRCFNA